MKRTPLYDVHVKEGAKIVEFAGFEMPLQYRGIIPEHLSVRERVGIFDVSHMGRFFVRGKDALKFIYYVTTNNPEKLEVNQAQYSLMCYPHGGIVDDLLVYKIDNETFFLVVNAANTEKDWNWLNENKKGEVEIENVTERIAQVAVQGPLSEEVSVKILGEQLKTLAYYRASYIDYDNKKIFISRTGYTGEDGFEIYMEGEDIVHLWNEFREQGVVPCGLGARDTLRLEMKYALYGNDIDETTNPVEAGLLWVVDLNKENFIGKDAILRVKQEKPRRKLVAMVMKDKGIPRHGYKIFGDGEIGYVTSGTFSPSLKKGIAMGYVNRSYHKVGSRVLIEIRDKKMEAEVVKPPFYKNASHR